MFIDNFTSWWRHTVDPIVFRVQLGCFLIITGSKSTRVSQKWISYVLCLSSCWRNWLRCRGRFLWPALYIHAAHKRRAYSSACACYLYRHPGRDGRVYRRWWSTDAHLSAELGLVSQLFNTVLQENIEKSSAGWSDFTAEGLWVGGRTGDRAGVRWRWRQIFLLHRTRRRFHYDLADRWNNCHRDKSV